MRRIKVAAIFVLMFSTILIFPKGMSLKTNALEDQEVKIGDKYEKKFISKNGDNEDLSILRNELSLDKRFSCESFETYDEDNETLEDAEELLVPKTNKQYEIALAYEDGDYTYAGTADNYEDAVKKAEEENNKIKTITNSFVVPVVLNTKTESIAYASYEIGRCYKTYKNPEKSDKYNRVCNMFKDSSLNGAVDRQIHDGFCSEMPLLDLDNSRGAARVYINGYSGWMNTDINRNASNDTKKESQDVRIEPINKVKNPSFYYVDNDGLLYHYISTSMVASEAEIGSALVNNDARKIGKAPDYLEKRVKYLSYDGKHFYSIKNRGIAKTLCVITDDLKNGNFNGAVNPVAPYYNYYLYLPFRSRTNYTAEDLNKYIDYYLEENAKIHPEYSESVLRGIGDILIKNQNKYGVNALLTLSVAINESQGGTSSYAKDRKNLFGLNATDYDTDKNTTTFEAIDACVEDFCKNYISRGFADFNNYTFHGGFLGNKAFGANTKYASDPYWADKAANSACKIENYLSGFNRTKYKDYDYYQLCTFKNAGVIKGLDNSVKYKINDKFSENSGSEYAGSVAIVLCNNTIDLGGSKCTEVALDITPNESNVNDGSYSWNHKGYIDSNNIELINTGKTSMDKADLDKDGDIDGVDLAKEASLYNASGNDLNYIYDLNDDGIIDIYDIVKISSKL